MGACQLWPYAPRSFHTKADMECVSTCASPEVPLMEVQVVVVLEEHVPGHPKHPELHE